MKHLLAAVIVAGTPTFASAQVLTVDAGNSPYVVSAPTSFDSVAVLASGELVIDSTLTVAGDVVVEPTGIITHSAGVTAMDLVVGGTLELKTGSGIDASARGLIPGALAGFGNRGATISLLTSQIVAGSDLGTGGSHGGRGGRYQNGSARAEPYDVAHDPVYPGGGGGRSGCTTWNGGAGGGVIRLSAATLIQNGLIAVDGVGVSGRCGGQYPGGGGAGGSIVLSIGDWSGAGQVTARGGAGSGGGGGGIIRVSYSTRSHDGFVSTSGGAGWGNDGIARPGELGLSQFESTASDLVARGGVLVLDGTTNAASLTLEAGGVVRIDGAAAVALPIVVAAGSTLILTSANAHDALTIDGTIAGTLQIDAAAAVTQDLTVSGTLVINTDFTVNGDVTIATGGTLTHSAEASSMNFVVNGTLDLAPGGLMNVAGKGLPAAAPSEYGTRGATISVTTLVAVPGSGLGNGASHGGIGGRYNAGESLAALYDDPANPVHPGGGGGRSGCATYHGGAGGGVLRVDADSFIHDGTISADGIGASGRCGGQYPGGGGAGGTIALTVGSWTGSGQMTAVGGSGAGGGGGGIVHVTYVTRTHSGPINTAGGAGWDKDGIVRTGSAGLVHLESTATDLVAHGGELTIDSATDANSVVLEAGAVVRITGAATVSQPLTVPDGTTLILGSSNALDALSVDGAIDGTLRIDAATTFVGNITVSGTLVVNAELQVQGDVTVVAGGRITHSATVTTMHLDVTGTFDLKVGGLMTAQGAGLPPGASAGFGSRGATISAVSYEVSAGSGLGTGGSHGGPGGQYADGQPWASIYDDPMNPAYPGGGGGRSGCASYHGGAGGGVLRVSAPIFVHEGIITADGVSVSARCGGQYPGGGGAGGTVALTVGDWSGSGPLTAKGGAGAGGGGGGIVRVIFATRTHDGSIDTSGGGAWTNNGTVRSGTPGLVSVTSTANALVVHGGEVIVDAGVSLDAITVEQSGVLRIQGAVNVGDPIRVDAGGTVILESEDALNNLSLHPAIGGVLRVDVPLVMLTDLTVSGTLIVNDRLELSNLTVLAGGVVTHTRGIDTMHLVVRGVFDLAVGSQALASGDGLRPGSIAGRGSAGETIDPILLTLVNGSSTQNGGSHGGQGGRYNSSAAIAAIYDDPMDPRFLGGGGGKSNCSDRYGGYGGGLIRITAGVLRHAGAMRVDGYVSDSPCGGQVGGGGGAGGSVILDLGEWEGVGPISAHGGNSSGGGGGGGGIVLASYASSTWSGAVDVAAGSGGTPGAVGVSNVLEVSQAPRIVTTPPADVLVGQMYRYLPAATGSDPIDWRLVIGPPGATVDVSTGEFTWTPPDGQLASATIEASNALGNSRQTIDLTPVVAPTITSSANTDGVAGYPYSYDADGTAEASGSNATWMVTLGPAAASIDPTSGQFSWTPMAGGIASICITATNPAGADEQCFQAQIAASGVPPVIDSTARLTAVVDVPYAYDADGAAEASGLLPITWVATTGPTGFSIDSLSGLITWAPAAPGFHDVCIEARNPFGAAEQCFTVAVSGGADGPPVVVHTANEMAAIHIEYLYDDDQMVEAISNQVVTWSKTEGPANFRIDSRTGRVTWKPNALGAVSITVQATNALGSDIYQFEVTVGEDVVPAPVAVIDLDPLSGAAPLEIFASSLNSFAAPGGTIDYYEWTFGDGSPPAFDATANHTYMIPGSYSIDLQVKDSLGAVGGARASVSVLSPQGFIPPTATILVSSTIGTDTLEPTFSCHCQEGSAPIAAYRWDFEDGSAADAASVSHLFGPGAYQVRLSVVDANGLAATDEVEIRVSEGANWPPVLVAQATPVAGPSPLVVDYRASFVDTDGEVVDVTWTFPDGTTSSEVAPTRTYAEAGAHGATIVVTDDLGSRATASIEVIVTDPQNRVPPKILSIPRTTGAVGEAYTYDADGLPAARGDSPMLWSLGKMVGATRVGAPDGMVVDAATGRITWTPAAEKAGTVDVVLIAQNDAGVDAEQWQVEVVGGADDGSSSNVARAAGCGCRANATPGAMGWLLLFFVGLRRYRSRATFGS